MKRRPLNEVTQEEILSAAIEKSLSRTRMNLNEIEALMELDMGALIVEHSMTYDQAAEIMYWLKNETYRMNAQYLQEPVDGWVLKGARHGSPALFESFRPRKLNIRQLRKIILEEIKKI